MSFFQFTSNFSIRGREDRVTVLFYHHNGDCDQTLAEKLDEVLNQPLPVNRILVICQFGEEVALERHFEIARQSIEPRLVETSHLCILPYDYKGKPVDTHIKFLKATSRWKISEKFLVEATRRAIEFIVEQTETVWKAPPGYLFRKPSQNSGDLFIRAGNMLKDPAASAVIFYSLIRKLPHDAAILYVDSFTILSIALKIQLEWPALASRCQASIPTPTIVNFHSYDITDELRFEGNPNSVVLISASTSGSLAKKLAEEHGAPQDRIFHLLVFSENTDLQEGAIYFGLRKPSRLPVGQFEFHKYINIPGEEFMASHSDAKAVRITTSHVSRKLGESLKTRFYCDNTCVRLSPESGRSYQPFAIASHDRIGSEIFDEWLEREIQLNLPPSTSLILAVDDARSTMLAAKTQSLAADYLGSRIQIATTNTLTGSITRRMTKSSSILIVCSEESLGDGLLRASLALRDVRHQHRHYLVAHFLGESSVQQSNLISTLVTSGSSNRKYGWSDFMRTAIGETRLHLSWQHEYELLTRVANFQGTSTFGDTINVRLGAMRSGALSGNLLFLPKVNGETLELRPDSVLFSKPYSSISHPAIYLQVASTLQRAREGLDWDKNVLGPDYTLSSSPFLDSVLHPNTFTRYSDGVISAALLRAACPSELNYARSNSLSKEMSQLLENVFEQRHGKPGEAALEFLFAIWSKKLKLQRDEFNSTLRIVQGIPELASMWRLWNTPSPI